MQNFSSGFIAPMISGMGGIFLPAADAKTSFIDARDIAAVGIAALTEPGHAGKAYALTGGQAHTYGEAAEIPVGPGQADPLRALSEDEFSGSLAAQGWQPGRSRCSPGSSRACARAGPPRPRLMWRMSWAGAHYARAVRTGSRGDLAVSSRAPGS